MFTQDTLILINDKVITKNDFIKRAEYTIRPNYCNSKSNLDKKIILNSLIAEKLYAIENSESEIDDYKVLNSIKGIEEQTMRKVMLEDYVNHNLKSDTVQNDIINMDEASSTILKEQRVVKSNVFTTTRNIHCNA